MVYNFERTDFPEIFRGTLWGRLDSDEKLVSSEIINNRNAFAREYAIDKCIDKSKVSKNIYDLICNKDHTEVYESKSGAWVLVNSPHYISEEHAQKLFEDGWKKRDPLYTVGYDAKSFVKVVPSQH